MSDLPTLVLFDIDGTLIQTARAGIRGMNASFERLYGRADVLETIQVSGRTDRAIVTDAFRVLALDATPERVLELREMYLGDLRREIHLPGEGFKGVLPGADALVDALRARPDVVVGLLTGNFAGAAEIKLGYFDLWDRFEFGAFGDDHINRRDLVPVALDACNLGQAAMAPDRVVIIGDTPLDVDCAHAHGALAVAVPTGGYDRESLAAARADLVVDTLAELVEQADWLDKLRRRAS